MSENIQINNSTRKGWKYSKIPLRDKQILLKKVVSENLPIKNVTYF